MFDPKLVEQYIHTEEDTKYINRIWSEFRLMWELRNRPLDFLQTNLQGFWDKSNTDYNILAPLQQEGDPVKSYTSPISRDQSDLFIANLAGQLLIPSVTAENPGIGIDKTIGRIAKSLLDWAHQNDGFPSDNGHQKLTRAIHKMVVEGTVHIQDNVSIDGLESELVPNEEIFIPNFWESNIQKQGMLIRAKLNLTWEEGEAIWGELPNWKYVKPGFTDWWFVQRPKFKQLWDGILRERRLQVIYVWIPLNKKELAEQKDKGRLDKKCKKAKWFNIIINDIPMLPLDTLSPYKDGEYPISKGVFCYFSKSEFYWGNSLPNKIKQDKDWMDSWKTLLRYKGKLNALPPLISKNGVFIDEEILLPNKITPISDNVELTRIEGVGDPISQSDVKILEMAEADVANSTRAPQIDIDTNAKVGNASIMESNAQKVMNFFVMQVAFLIQARTFPILMRLFQFLPRSEIKTIAIPDQVLPDGTNGSLEIIWKKLPKMTPKQLMAVSYAIKVEQMDSAELGNNKEIRYLDPEYVRCMNYYVRYDFKRGVMAKSELEKQQFNQNLPIYLQNPDIFNRQRVGRKFIQMNGDDDSLLNESSQGGQPQAPQSPPQPGQLPQGIIPQMTPKNPNLAPQ